MQESLHQKEETKLEVALKEAKAEGKVFLGWYLEKECINKVEKIEKGTSGDITLYAKWQ